MTHETNDATVDLGTASIETRGPTGTIFDQRFGQAMPGLADD